MCNLIEKLFYFIFNFIRIIEKCILTIFLWNIVALFFFFLIIHEDFNKRETLHRIQWRGSKLILNTCIYKNRWTRQKIKSTPKRFLRDQRTKLWDAPLASRLIQKNDQEGWFEDSWRFWETRLWNLQEESCRTHCCIVL